MFKLQYSKAVISDSIKINVDYYPIICKNTRSEIDSSGDSFISATYTGRINEPNVQYIDSGNTPVYYQSVKIHVFGNIHKISDINYDGEIIIEHNPTISNNTKLFCCFPVKQIHETRSPQKNSIGKLISSTSVYSPDNNPNSVLGPNISLSMDEYLDFKNKDPKAICYETVNRLGVKCKVIVFTDVLQTDSDISTFSRDGKSLFNNIPVNSPSIVSIGDWTTREYDEYKGYSQPIFIQEGFGTAVLAGGETVLTSDGAAGDIFSCEYLPVSTDTAQVFQIPIGTDLVTSKTNEDATSVVLYFIVSVVMASIIFTISPVIYNLPIFDSFRDDLPEQLEWMNSLFNTKNMGWIDVIMILVMSILSFSLIVAGISNKSNTTKIAGLFFLIVSIVGYGGIYVSGKMSIAKTANEAAQRIINKI